LSKPPGIVERTFQFAIKVVKLADQVGRNSFSAKTLLSQIIRSATSIGANIEEAQAAESRPDFIHKYNIALKESRETRYWLKLLSASNAVPKQDLPSLIKESDEISRIIAQIIINTKRKK